MSKYQFYSPLDPLSSYKTEKSEQYRNCDFYENFQNGTITTLRSGYVEESPILETVITDGHISIDSMSHERGFIIVKNVLFGLENSRGINIKIDDGSFMVSSILIDEKRINNIHVEAGSIALYDRILDYLYNKGHINNISTIGFTEPAVVEFMNPYYTELFYLKNGKTKRKSR